MLVMSEASLVPGFLCNILLLKLVVWCIIFSIEQPRHEDSEVPCRQIASVLIYVLSYTKRLGCLVRVNFFCNRQHQRSLQLGLSYFEL